MSDQQQRLTTIALAIVFGTLAGGIAGGLVVSAADPSAPSVVPAAVAGMTGVDHAGFELVDRNVVPYGVPTFRSSSRHGNDKPTAFDVMPRGAPRDNNNNGVAWIDICNADLLRNAKAPVDCLYGGAFTDKVVFGTRSFNGSGAKPLYLRIEDKVIGKLDSSGLEIYGKVNAKTFNQTK